MGTRREERRDGREDGRGCPLHNVTQPTGPPGERIIAVSHAKVIIRNCLKIAL